MSDSQHPLSTLADLAAGKSVHIEAVGGSMFPTIRHGDRVRLRPLLDAPRVGDIVLFVSEGRWVLHRVVAAGSATWTTRGDFCLRADRPVRRAQIVGLAVSATRRGRTRKLEWRPGLAALWTRVAPLNARLGHAALALRRTIRGAGASPKAP